MARTAALCLLLLAVSASMQEGGAVRASDCESGVLDGGEAGMNVLVYQLCADRLTVGFRDSEVIEEMTCGPAGSVHLWMSTDHEICGLPPAPDSPRIYDLLEPLRGIGGTASAPVAKRVTCGGTSGRATAVVSDARAALLATRTGDTIYEQVSRRFIRQCMGPSV
ncbi:hypothetical protein [Reyranella sp.]|jgi:hypothetical protein|uniref:hypothetical protein n=1 Tax=Reyranella sp. TaxID=1929291 RepID=UPI000BD069FD|nr:hypothetical protein [Reyranella sp.]OYY40063.1 MAG: hypothetical protein B7Y57_18265 [Rhodospirillales bacterium 35-66-84]OYZ92472.1 MAG: hypothetical protein B7Y08_20860 [Rhodospirillales bacterium 24-66-33]OZB23780.1 MAG: hypothetical protein B7X63_17725 [Rhodospirillales bacterium 39-66-50]HQS17049.1 hypothetical protein [Reyranella sp.]HQT14980.1 hypothetical protein [Reyranella sp.]